MIDGKNFFDKPINSDHDDFETYENIRKIATGKGDDNTTQLFTRNCKSFVNVLLNDLIFNNIK